MVEFGWELDFVIDSLGDIGLEAVLVVVLEDIGLEVGLDVALEGTTAVVAATKFAGYYNLPSATVAAVSCCNSTRAAFIAGFASHFSAVLCCIILPLVD